MILEGNAQVSFVIREQGRNKAVHQSVDNGYHRDYIENDAGDLEFAVHNILPGAIGLS